MSAEALLRAQPAADRGRGAATRSAGVLCRCTGYRKIVEAVLAAAAGAVVDAPVAARGRGGRQPRARGSMRRPRCTGGERFGADALPGDAGAACWRCA